MFSFEARTNGELLKTRTDFQPSLYAYGDNRTTFLKGRLLDCHYKHCGKLFQDPAQLEAHLRCHSGKQPYVCDWPGCDKKFTLNFALKKHLLSHCSWIRPFSCTWPGCGKKFAENHFLKAHMRTHTEKNYSRDGSHSRTFSYKCYYVNCGKIFHQKSNFDSHLLMHTRERPYACEWPGCNKKCSQKGNLKIHMLTHTGERPFVCERPGCGASFSQKRSFKSHMLKHLEESNRVPSVWGENQNFFGEKVAQFSGLSVDLPALDRVNEESAANEFQTWYNLFTDQQQFFDQFSPIKIQPAVEQNQYQWNLTGLMKSSYNEVYMVMPDIKVEPKEEPQDLPEEYCVRDLIES